MTGITRPLWVAVRSGTGGVVPVLEDLARERRGRRS